MNNNHKIITYAVNGLPFMGNPKHVVIHNLDRTLANYNEASFNMVKNDAKRQLANCNFRVNNCRLV